MTNPSPERWARIEEALDAALDRLDEDRVALLDELCGDDDELRREVSRLLVSIDRAGSSFERPPVEMVHEAAATAGKDQLEPGRVVGAYRVVELLGRGGMGAVYLAERADGAFDRQVALKIVKRGMDSEEILRRFRRERQILARLEHPNIAGLLDGGITDDGVPYFVMELARGQPIDDWCDAHALTIEQRIRLFLPVCDAVRHAHRSLIVHRDLKPSNIVVVEGQPKLLDFGIAKMLSADEEEAQATRLQERRLTPEYAAPEQVRGEPTTTATDVYALGVILYELLTGRPPYRVQGGFAEVERVVCTVEPRAPSSVAARDEIRGSAGEDALTLAMRRGARPEALRNALQGDLDAIVLRALAKEPERRYPSVNALMEDLQRHLMGHPVEARPTSRWYHFTKFVRRNRTAVGLATAAALALVIGSAVALWQAGRAELESRRRLAEAERATAARDYLIGLFRDLNPDRLQGQRTFSLDDLVRLGVRNLEPLSDQPELQASVMNAVGEVVFNLGDDAEADSLFSRAHDILETRGEHPDLAESMMGLGEIHRRGIRFGEAEQWFRKALEIRRRALPGDDPRVAESIVALAFALYNVGSEESLAEARVLYRQVLSFSGRLPAEIRASALEGLADLSLDEQQYEEARRLYAECLDSWSEAVGPDHPSYGRALWGYARALTRVGQLKEAEQAFRNALRIMESTYGLEHRDVVWGHYYLGLHLYEHGDPEEAARHFERAASVSEIVNAPGYRYTGLAWDRLGRTRLKQGRFEEAERSFRRSIRVYESADSLTPGASARAGAVRLRLGQELLRQSRYAEAERELRLAYQSLSAAGGRSAEVRAAAGALATLFERTGRPDSSRVYRVNQ